MSNKVNPLPSLIRASAEDAANAAMRKAGRTVWSGADYNTAAKTQERLIRTCYSLRSDKDRNLCYIRFGMAERLQKNGHIELDSDWSKVMTWIEAQVTA